MDRRRQVSDWRMAVHYRNRAELLRTIAQEITHTEHGKALSKVAEYYESVADSLERNTRAKAS